MNEQLPLTPVEPEVMTERRTVKICCCIPKGDVLLNAWYINMFLFLFYVVGPLRIPMNVESNDQLQAYVTSTAYFIQISDIMQAETK